MATITRRVEFQKAGSTVLISKSYSADSLQSMTPTIADGVTDGVVELAVTFDRMKWLLINTDQEVLIESADGASANANSHTLTASSPLMWFEDDPTDNPLDDSVLTKITKLLVTNSSGETANLTIEVGYDPTP